MKGGPGRRELWFRVGFSVLGLGLLGFVLVRHFGRADASAAVGEVVIIAGLFFGGTLGHALWRLWRPPEG